MYEIKNQWYLVKAIARSYVNIVTALYLSSVVNCCLLCSNSDNYNSTLAVYAVSEKWILLKLVRSSVCKLPLTASW